LNWDAIGAISEVLAAIAVVVAIIRFDYSAEFSSWINAVARKNTLGKSQ